LESLYNMIIKRKSFHVFKNPGYLTQEELEEIENQFQFLQPLKDEIQVNFKIVPKENTSCKRGEYCVLFFSEKSDGYLHNIGYLGAQLDLWLASKNVGVCWYGVGKTEVTPENDLDFVIMMAIAKVNENDFRKDYTKSKRKPLDVIWNGELKQNIAKIVRFTPSACNTQPWYVESKDNQLYVYRIKGKRGIMPADKVVYYNRIDIGIFLLFMELCLKHEGMAFTRTLFADTEDEKAHVLTAKYTTNHL